MDSNERKNWYISKVNLTEGFVYTKVLWKENENYLFDLKIFEGCDNRTWSGRFSNENAEKCRETFENEDFDYYKNSVKLALTGHSDSFVYDFVDDKNQPNIKIFKWKKVFEDSAIVVHGSVTMYKDSVPDSKNIIIDFLLQQNRCLEESIKDCNKRNVEINKDLSICKAELEEMINMKTCLEEMLYGKFVQLLNEKKKRIQLLEDTIQNFSD